MENYRVKDYLANIVNFPVDEKALDAILVKRGLCGDTPYSEAENKDIELCQADLYMWICTSPSKIGGDSDSDNGWSHKDGGYTLSSKDKKRLTSIANSIYDTYGERKILTSHFRIVDHGVKHCNLGLNPYDHVEAKG
nr:MAG TPA: hypothetical protein [Caudoviricetes sp.]